jgi:hypothetical protein
MYPHVIQFETHRVELDRQIQLYRERRLSRVSSNEIDSPEQATPSRAASSHRPDGPLVRRQRSARRGFWPA